MTVIVQATDPDGASAKQNITVDVQTPPAAPVVEGTIPNFDLLLGASSVTIDASLYFSDPNGDELTLTSSDTAVAHDKSVGSLGDREPRGRRHSNNNRHGNRPRIECYANVHRNRNCNSAPTPVGNGSNANSPRRWIVLSRLTWIITSTIADEAVIYTATSSDTGIATVSVLSANVSITGKALGTATITVTANDTFATATVNNGKC